MERRAHSRHAIRLPLVHWLAEADPAREAGIERTTHDLACGGVAYRSDTMPPIGSQLRTELHLPGEARPLSLRAEVARVGAELDGEGYRVGLRFVDLQPDAATSIEACIGSLDLGALTRKALDAGASDLHFTVGRAPTMRVDGRLVALDVAPLIDGQIKAMLYPLLDANQIHRLERDRELDFAFSPETTSRFRVNLHFQRGFLEAVLRSVPVATQSFVDLRLPAETMERLCRAPSGLLLVAGTTGSGKTTTVSAMVDAINRTQERVIITIESPIEFLHASERSLVKQRELGTDTSSYAEALTRALRQDPDVIVVGELTDRDCVDAALRAAETGHLVITTVHAPDAAQAIERLIHFYPPAHATTVAQQVSTCLLAALYQRLLPASDGGRVLATELLVATTAVRNLVREEKFNQLATCMQTGRASGMHTLQSSIDALRQRGLIAEPR